MDAPLRDVEDKFVPPDHAAFVAAEPPTGRVIVIAPTRAACETIEIALSLHVETYLERTHGQRLRELARSGQGFGIVAGTGTGKTLAVRAIAEEILKAPLRIGVVNREREATPELPTYNIVVVTTGIARRWFQDGDILTRDTLVVDEIHQTSAELELCLALGKRVGCRFIWLSATVDPRFYRNYLNSGDVLEVYSFDPEKAAEVRVLHRSVAEFLSESMVRTLVQEKRGVGIFLPTRAGVEQAAEEAATRYPELNVAFYHGGEPVRTIRPFLEEEGAPKPFLLAMTAAGQSALNVRGLDTVVIEDSRFTNLIQRGRNVLTRQHLGSNEILQMAGRVHGRVRGGRVFILSDRDIRFETLSPTAPEFQLAGNSERVALTCADLGVRADELDLPVPLDGTSYRRALNELQRRGLIAANGRLSKYGKAVEALPVDRQWGELIVHAPDALVPYLAVMSSIESLHRMTRDERNLDGLVLPGSDHLTAYNLYAEAHQKAGYEGLVFGLPRHLFEATTLNQWAEERGVLVKSIEDAALAVSSLYRSLGMKLPTAMPLADRAMYRQFATLLAQWMPFDLVINETTAQGQEARVSRSSVCGTVGAVTGTLRYFSDRYGEPRAGIEGTQIPDDIIEKMAERHEPEFFYDARRRHAPLVLRTRLMYGGFELRSEAQPVKEFEGAHRSSAHLAIAQALAHEDTGHPAEKINQAIVVQVRDFYQRSGGKTPRLGRAELATAYCGLLEAEQVVNMHQFGQARLHLRLENFVPLDEQRQLRKLPGVARVGKLDLPLEYAVEEVGGVPTGVVRLLLPEKLARSVQARDLPRLDRPLRLVVSRGSQGALAANSLEELQVRLEGRWTPTEPAAEVVFPTRPAARSAPTGRAVARQPKRRPRVPRRK